MDFGKSAKYQRNLASYEVNVNMVEFSFSKSTGSISTEKGFVNKQKVSKKSF